MNEKIDTAVQLARDLRARLRDASLAGAKVAVRTRLWDEVPKFAQVDLLRMALREGVNVGNVHAVHARANPERLALVDDRYAWDFVETNDKINQVCHAFTHLVPRGQRPRVILCMENRVEYALVWFALFRLGWAAVHASNVSTVEELRFLFEGSEAAIAVGSESTRARLEAAAPSGCSVLTVDTPPKDASAIDFHVHISGFARTHFRRERNASGENVVYTSGTTGKPKGAVRDFGGMGVMELVEILERMPISLEEKHLVVSKLYHSAGQAFTLIMAALGATIYIEDKFEPEALLASIHRHKITSMFMVPTMISRVLQVDDDVFAKYPPTELQTIISGAGLFTHALRERAIARFGADTIHDFYGASELGWVTLISGREMLERKGSQGRPLRGQEIRIVDGKKVLPPHQIGLIQVRTQTRMEGYLGDEASSQEILSDDDWMTVDDTGYLDEDGYLYLAGRARDMIISGGVNIYPAEIEEVLIRHPDVLEVSVVGAPDDEWGEKLVGFIAGKEGLDPIAVQKWAREFLAGYKVPREWFRVSELPRNPTGKVLKKDLEIVAKLDVDQKLPKDASDVARAVFKEAERFDGTKKGTKKAAAKKSTAKKPAVKKPAAKKKTTAKTTAKKSAAKKPAAKKATAKKSTAKKPAAKKATAKKSTAKKPAAKKPAAKKSAAKNATKSTAKSSAADTKADTKKVKAEDKTTTPAAKKSTKKTAAAPKKATAKKSAKTSAAKKSSAEKPAAAKSATAKKSTAKSPATKKSTTQKASAKSKASSASNDAKPAKKSTKPRTPKKARSPRSARKNNA